MHKLAMKEIISNFKKGRIIAYCENMDPLISFDVCFENEFNLNDGNLNEIKSNIDIKGNLNDIKGNVDIKGNSYSSKSNLSDIKGNSYSSKNVEISLPKQFLIREDRIFIKSYNRDNVKNNNDNRNKLKIYKNTLYKIKIEGIVKRTEYKNHLPTIFDINYIKKENSKVFKSENFKFLVEMSNKVLGEEETKEIFFKYK